MISYNIDSETFVITFTDEKGGISIFDKDTFIDRPFANEEIARIFADKILKMNAVNLTYPLSLEEVKKKMKENCSIGAKQLLLGRPAVDTGLGFSVDGGYNDLKNLEAGQTVGLTFVKDIDGNNQTIVENDWDTIINAVKTNIVEIYQLKWNYENEVNEAESIEALKELNNPFD